MQKILKTCENIIPRLHLQEWVRSSLLKKQLAFLSQRASCPFLASLHLKKKIDLKKLKTQICSNLFKFTYLLVQSSGDLDPSAGVVVSGGHWSQLVLWSNCW